jgi:hypothetical protein
MSSDMQKVYIRERGKNEYFAVISLPPSADKFLYLDQIVAQILSAFLIYIKTNNKPIEWFTRVQNNIHNCIFECEDLNLQKNIDILPMLQKAKEFSHKRSYKAMAIKKTPRLLGNPVKIQDPAIWFNTVG